MEGMTIDENIDKADANDNRHFLSIAIDKFCYQVVAAHADVGLFFSLSTRAATAFF